MLRITKAIEVQNLPSLEAVTYIEGFCVNGDTKPTERIATGSNIIEVDTGDVYFYDEETSTWDLMLNLKS